MSQKYEKFLNNKDASETNEKVNSNGTDLNKSIKTNGKVNDLSSPSSSSASSSISPPKSPIEINSAEEGTVPVEDDLSLIRRRKVRRIVENIYFRIFGLILILIDCVLLIVDLSIEEKSDTLKRVFDIISLIFITYFVIEVCLRIYGKSAHEFFSIWWDTLDFSVIIVSFFVTIVYVTSELSGFTRLVLFGRLIRLFRLIRILRLFTEPRNVQKGMRHAVSENKRRYRTSLFDLDLTYITERVIAMSFPSTGKMALYRNNIRDVSAFLDLRHGPGNYKVYNLCSEKHYDGNWFHGRVVRVAIDDHNVPSLHQMKEFVHDADQWLKASENHVIAVHCKGGKGRTGTMICAWLIYSGQFSATSAALTHFADRRTDKSVGDKFQGIETPSQSRYVEYFTKVISGEIPPKRTLILKNFKIHSLIGIGAGNGSDFTCTIYINRMDTFQLDFGAGTNCRVEYNPLADILHIEPVNCPPLAGDVRMKFNCRSKSVPRAYEDCAWYFWFNTDFVTGDEMVLRREDLDNTHKRKTWKLYRENFGVNLNFEDAPKGAHLTHVI